MINWYILLRYNPRYYFAIETSYGTTTNLKEMIDELHKNGIRVIVDSVRKLIADSWHYLHV